jgi:hypothetical protein
VKYRKLRITFSVACGIFCLLLIVLLVRSYQTFDRLGGPMSSKHSAIVISHTGHLSVVFTQIGFGWTGLKYDSGPIQPPFPYMKDELWPQPTTFGFGVIRNASSYMNIPNEEVGWHPQGLTGRSYTAGGSGVIVPYWFLMVIAVGLAVVPWIR